MDFTDFMYLFELSRYFLREQVETIYYFFALRCQTVGFFSILSDKVVGFEVLKVKINLGMVFDLEISGNIHKSHFLLNVQKSKDLSSDLVGETGQSVIHIEFDELLLKLQDFEVAFYRNNEFISFKWLGKVIVCPIFHRRYSIIHG